MEYNLFDQGGGWATFLTKTFFMQEFRFVPNFYFAQHAFVEICCAEILGVAHPPSKT